MERGALEELFARYRLPVYRFLHRLTGDPAVAEDLTQDTFLRVLEADYEPRDEERAWVFQIARNLARDHSRRAIHRGPTLPGLDDPAPFIEPAVALHLRSALAALPDDDREMFLMREVAGLSYLEIAAACGVSSDAVRNRLYRARVALRGALSSNVVPMKRACQ